MTDQTDRQRAEAKKVRALMLGKPLEDQWEAVADALLSARREGWEAGQKDMRDKAVAACGKTADFMLDRGKSSHGAALCADRVAVIPISQPEPKES